MCGLFLDRALENRPSGVRIEVACKGAVALQAKDAVSIATKAGDQAHLGECDVADRIARTIAFYLPI